MNNPFDFTGKSVFITGASRGIGLESAKLFAGFGAKVFLVASSQENAAKAAAGVKGEVVPVGLDLRDSKAIEAFAGFFEQEKVDVFVHSAGITKDTLLLRMGEQDWLDVMQVNLHAAFLLTKLITKAMMKHRAGKIVLISSVVGHTGNAGQANYAATKAGLIGFAKSAAQEFASRNIQINVLSPGFIETDMTKDLKQEQKDSLLGKIPMKRMGTPVEIAEGVVFLSSSYASYITGAVLHVNGGLY